MELRVLFRFDSGRLIWNNIPFCCGRSAEFITLQSKRGVWKFSIRREQRSMAVFRSFRLLRNGSCHLKVASVIQSTEMKEWGPGKSVKLRFYSLSDPQSEEPGEVRNSVTSQGVTDKLSSSRGKKLAQGCEERKKTKQSAQEDRNAWHFWALTAFRFWALNTFIPHHFIFSQGYHSAASIEGTGAGMKMTPYFLLIFIPFFFLDQSFILYFYHMIWKRIWWASKALHLWQMATIDTPTIYTTRQRSYPGNYSPSTTALWITAFTLKGERRFRAVRLKKKKKPLLWTICALVFKSKVTNQETEFKLAGIFGRLKHMKVTRVESQPGRSEISAHNLLITF